jgi:hypothetical protein
VHTQFFPAVWGLLRSLPGQGMEEKVRKEVAEHMGVKVDLEGKTLSAEMTELGLTSADDRFGYAFCSYSNNFWAKVVDSDPKVIAENFEGRLAVLDEPLGPILKAAWKEVRKDPKHYHVYPKSVMWRRTARQFYADIRRAFYGVGLKDEDLQRVRAKGRGAAASAELGRLLFPVYVRLREWGYADHDLG